MSNFGKVATFSMTMTILYSRQLLELNLAVTALAGVKLNVLNAQLKSLHRKHMNIP